MNYFRYIFLFILLSYGYLAISQDTVSDRLIYHGVFRDALLKKNIAHVHVINKNKASGTISDTSGFFSLPARKSDTLFVTAIGYEFELVPVDSQALLDGDTVLIPLVPRIYTLPEVVIYELDTYEKFKKRFFEVELKEEGFTIPGLPDVKPRGTPKLLDPDYIKSAGFAISSPASFLYYNFSRREKNRRLYYELMEKERIKGLAENKFGKQEIAEMTGLEGEELEEFIEFLGLTPEQILYLSEYEIRKRITDKMEVFRR